MSSAPTGMADAFVLLDRRRRAVRASGTPRRWMPTRARPSVPAVLLDDLVADANGRAPNLLGGHDLATAHRGKSTRTTGTADRCTSPIPGHAPGPCPLALRAARRAKSGCRTRWPRAPQRRAAARVSTPGAPDGPARRSSTRRCLVRPRPSTGAGTDGATGGSRRRSTASKPRLCHCGWNASLHRAPDHALA